MNRTSRQRPSRAAGGVDGWRCEFRDSGGIGNQGGRIELMAVSADSVPQYARATKPDAAQPDWTPWAKIGTGGYPADTLTPIRNADGRLEVFALDFHGEIEHVRQTAPNSAWGAWDFL